MKILTAAEMREVDRLTIERGIPGLILMENAGSRVVDVLRETFAPLSEQRVVVICGKGNNGGDGFAIARQLFTRALCRQLTVIEFFEPELLSGDAQANRQMLEACGCPVLNELPNEANLATVVVDAILGTGLAGAANGPALRAIRLINNRFPLAKVVAVDIPSGLPPDATNPTGEFVRADYTVTFTAAKRSQCLSPSYEFMGKLVVAPIGTPEALCATNPNFRLSQTTPDDIRHLFSRRIRNSNKGMYGHVLVAGGSFGKNGAPLMTGLASYRTGAGLVTVASPGGGDSHRPELMTEPLKDAAQVLDLLKKMTVLALGPGLGSGEDQVRFVKTVYEQAEVPAVVDADALNALAGALPRTSKVRILTPHPGEMARLTGLSVKDVQADRLSVAQDLADEHGAAVVLKGDRTVIAFPDGETWVNPTGSPALAKGGTGDILTGIIAGLVAQHPQDWKAAVVAAVWLHGRAGELAGAHWGEESALATDLLDYLPEAMNEVRPAV
jgi:NAD(P)H-hydrate epimerase